MNRFIAIHPSRCVACGTCSAACSEGHIRAGLQKEPRIQLYESRDVVASVTCHHCQGAPCVKVCPVNALRHDDDGCVRVDETHCIGCKLCAVACPFGAIHMAGTPRSGVAGTEYATSTFPQSAEPILRWEIGIYSAAVKCDLCSYDGRPKCVDACITNALQLVESGGEDDGGLAEKRTRALEEGVVMYDNLTPVEDENAKEVTQ